MANTDVSIYNLALLHLGIDKIDGFADGSVEATTGNLQYGITRDALLESHPWSFAYEFGELLTVLVATPTTAWDFQYTLPSGLRTLKRVHDQGWVLPFLKVANDRIYVNQSTSVYIDYVRDVGEAEFPNLFVQALAYQVAVDVGMTLTGDVQLLQVMQAKADEWLAIAKNRDSYQQTPRFAGRSGLRR